MTKAKSSNNLGLRYFFRKYNRLKKKFPTSFFFDIKTKKQTLAVDFPLYRSIVSDYLDVYFKEFHKSKSPVYFPLSGELVKVLGKGVYKTKDSYIKTKSINWIWYLRPAYNYVTNIKLQKLTGSNSRLKKLQENYKQKNDVGLLPKTSLIFNQLILERKMYK